MSNPIRIKISQAQGRVGVKLSQVQGRMELKGIYHNIIYHDDTLEGRGTAEAPFAVAEEFIDRIDSAFDNSETAVTDAAAAVRDSSEAIDKANTAYNAVGTFDSRLVTAESNASTAVSTANGVAALVPTQASTTNQLADKEFVNSSIATSTAKFQGTYESESELPTEGVDDNDYAFVSYVDSVGNNKYKRYKYTEVGWAFEYELNNSSFTAEQWGAINSGIDSDKVATYDGYATSLIQPMITSVVVSALTGAITVSMNKEVAGIQVKELVGGDDIAGTVTHTGTTYQFVPTNPIEVLANDWTIVITE